MAIPDFQKLMLPLLDFSRDQLPHTLAEARKHLANIYSLSNEDLNELLPSGKQKRFDNRVAWAKQYLGMAGLLDSPKRGSFSISSEGMKFLETKPKSISISTLDQFPKFRAFREGSKTDPLFTDTSSDKIETITETPEELLEKSFNQIQNELALSLLNQLKNCTSSYFENIVVMLLEKMGYGKYRKDAGKTTGKTGDEGIDGVINEDRLGLELLYIQAKCWKDITVGRPEIQKFVGALHGKRARKGVFITTSTFSNDAKKYVALIDPRVVLIDGIQLAFLMIEHGLGVSVKTTMELKKIDSDFFIED